MLLVYRQASCTIQGGTVRSEQVREGSRFTSRLSWRHAPEIDFTFALEGRTCRARGYDQGSLSFPDAGQAWGFVRGFVPGQTRSCWYDPADPGQAVLARTVPAWWIGFGLLVVPLCLAAAWGLRRELAPVRPGVPVEDAPPPVPLQGAGTGPPPALSEEDRLVLERLKRMPAVHEKALAYELRKRRVMDRTADEMLEALRRLEAAGEAYRGDGRHWQARTPHREPTREERLEEAKRRLLQHLHTDRGRSLADLVGPLSDYRDREDVTAETRDLLRLLALDGTAAERDGLWRRTR